MKSLLNKILATSKSDSCDSEDLVNGVLERKQRRNDAFVDMIMEERKKAALPGPVKKALRANSTLRNDVRKIIDNVSDQAEALEQLDSLLDIDEVFLNEESSSNEVMYRHLINGLTDYLDKIEGNTLSRI